MATRRSSNLKISVNCDILVNVQYVLEDLIVVRFVAHDKKVFQGVLLDSEKGNIPFGINPVGGFHNKIREDNPRDYGDDEEDQVKVEECYPRLIRRHTYYQDKSDKPPVILPSSRHNAGHKKRSIRLRARQVLCSRCSAVCNEKGENVRETGRINEAAAYKVVKPKPKVEIKNLEDEIEPSKPTVKAKPSTNNIVDASKKPRKRIRPFGAKRRKLRKKVVVSGTENVTENIVDLDDMSKRLAQSNSLVPKLKRLKPSEIERYSSNSDRESCSDSEKIMSSSLLSRMPSSDPSMQPLKMKFNLLQSQHYSIVSSIDEHDNSEHVDEDSKRSSEDEDNPPLKKVLKKDAGEKEKTAPVLKISFGKESRVLTVSGVSSSENGEVMEDDNDTGEEEASVQTDDIKKPDEATSKAAKKALKRAKKEAQRRSMRLASPAHIGGQSPQSGLVSNSPFRYSHPSPYRALTSPSASPYRALNSLSPGAQPFSGVSPGSSRFSSPNHQLGSASPAAYTLLCPSSQKLIIKKVKKKRKKDKNRDAQDLDQTPCSSTTHDDDLMENNDNEFQEVEDSVDGVDERAGVRVESAQLSDGHTTCVGDVVWAKSESNPWWPGKVTLITLKIS